MFHHGSIALREASYLRQNMLAALIIDLLSRSLPHTSNTLSLPFLSVVLVVVFGICWAPFHTDRLMWSFISDWTDSHHKIFEYVHIISGVFFYLSSAVNPILYNLMSTRFREMFKEVMCHRPHHINPRKHSLSVTRVTLRSTLSDAPLSNGTVVAEADMVADGEGKQKDETSFSCWRKSCGAMWKGKSLLFRKTSLFLINASIIHHQQQRLHEYDRKMLSVEMNYVKTAQLSANWWKKFLKCAKCVVMLKCKELISNSSITYATAKLIWTHQDMKNHECILECLFQVPQIEACLK